MVSTLPRNSQPHFFKYASTASAKKIITTQSFRWSSPLKFNDPFDHQTGVHFPFTGEELVEELKQRSEHIVYGNSSFQPAHNGNYPAFLSYIRQFRDRLPRDEFSAQIEKSGREIAENFPAMQRLFNQEITDFLTHSRVLCLAERNDNVVMWSHYADEHRGVVFKLRRLEAIDHVFLVARKVLYTNAPTTYFQLKDYVDNLCGLTNHDPSPIIWDIAYRKHPDWKYEDEWRIHRPLLDEPAGDGFEYPKEPKDLFEAVYLGCRMDPSITEEITRLVREHLPNTEIFQSAKALDQVALKFEKI